LIAGCWFQRLREEEKRQQEEFDRQRVAQVTIEVIVHAVFIIYITTIKNMFIMKSYMKYKQPISVCTTYPLEILSNVNQPSDNGYSKSSRIID